MRCLCTHTPTAKPRVSYWNKHGVNLDRIEIILDFIKSTKSQQSSSGLSPRESTVMNDVLPRLNPTDNIELAISSLHLVHVQDILHDFNRFNKDTF